MLWKYMHLQIFNNCTYFVVRKIAMLDIYYEFKLHFNEFQIFNLFDIFSKF